MNVQYVDMRRERYRWNRTVLEYFSCVMFERDVKRFSIELSYVTVLLMFRLEYVATSYTYKRRILTSVVHVLVIRMSVLSAM